MLTQDNDPIFRCDACNAKVQGVRVPCDFGRRMTYAPPEGTAIVIYPLRPVVPEGVSRIDEKPKLLCPTCGRRTVEFLADIRDGKVPFK